MARYILVDIEAERGISPFSSRMTEFGAVDLVSRKGFHGELWPFTPDPEISAIPVIAEDAVPFDHEKVFQDFATWLKAFDDKIVWVSDNPGYDMTFLNYYMDRYLGRNPGGFSSRRIGDLYAGLAGDWRDTSSWKRLRKTRHDHNPLNDCLGNAEALSAVLSKFNQKHPT